jgi:hypothetical protein
MRNFILSVHLLHNQPHTITSSNIARINLDRSEEHMGKCIQNLVTFEFLATKSFARVYILLQKLYGILVY